MLLHTCEGPRSIDERDIEHLSIEERIGRYAQVTMTLSGSHEISGLMLAEALRKIEERSARASKC
jgi:hypothetical protein